MKRTCLWTGMILGLLQGGIPAHAGSGGTQGGSGGPPNVAGSAAPNGAPSAGGIVGLSGFGQPNGDGAIGCSVSGGLGGMRGCQFSGCLGGFCSFSGCFGGFGSVPQQFYGDWHKFPGRSYSHRSLYVSNGFVYQPLTIVHYTDRPQYFYFYDPAQKKYVGRYRRGGKEKDCFAVIVPRDRRATLGEIAEKSYKRWSAMPTLAELTGTLPPSSPVTPSPQLVRPPDTLPGHDLPPDEQLEK